MTNTSVLTTHEARAVDTTKAAAPVQTLKHPPGVLEVCGDDVCGNGGTCRRLAGEAEPSCHCPLHFTGALCEKGELGHLSRLEPAELPSFQMCF